MQKVYTQGFFIPRRPIKLSLDLLLGYQREERLYFLNRQRNSPFLVDTKRCVSSNKSCVRSFPGCTDLNLAALCWNLAWKLGQGGTKKSTRYCTQWKTPQKWTIPCRTKPQKSPISLIYHWENITVQSTKYYTGVKSWAWPFFPGWGFGCGGEHTRVDHLSNNKLIQRKWYK